MPVLPIGRLAGHASTTRVDTSVVRPEIGATVYARAAAISFSSTATRWLPRERRLRSRKPARQPERPRGPEGAEIAGLAQQCDRPLRGRRDVLAAGALPDPRSGSSVDRFHFAMCSRPRTLTASASARFTVRYRTRSSPDSVNRIGPSPRRDGSPSQATHATKRKPPRSRTAFAGACAMPSNKR